MSFALPVANDSCTKLTTRAALNSVRTNRKRAQRVSLPEANCTLTDHHIYNKTEHCLTNVMCYLHLNTCQTAVGVNW